MRRLPTSSYGFLDPATISQQGVGKLTVNEVTGSVGFDNLKVPDHTICLLQDNVTTTETWEGCKLPTNDWKAGTVRFLPMSTDLSSRSVSAYNEAMFFFSDRWFRATVIGGLNHRQASMRFCGIPPGPLSNIVQALVSLSTAEERSPMLIESLSISLAVALVISLTTGASASLSNGLTSERMVRVTDYVEANLERQITLAELSSVAALSQFHFCRSFRMSAGVSPLSYVRQLRLAKAKRMLRERRYSLAFVADDCGFASQSHFTTAFKSATGTTPGGYRSLT